MVALLVAVLLALGGVLVWKWVFKPTSGNGQASLQTTISSSANPNPSANGQGKPDSADRIPGNALKQVDEDDYIGRSGEEARKDLIDNGLEPRVQSPQGTAPGDLKKCRVTAISPTGGLPVGSQVKVTCAP
jgi:serine/threonine-protein kinase